MAQLDPVIIFPLLWSLLFSLIIYYSISLEMLLPAFVCVKKFRSKKLRSFDFNNSKTNFKLNSSYKNF